MQKILRLCCCFLYLLLIIAYCGLELNLFRGDGPLLRTDNLLLLLNVLFIPLIPPVLYLLLHSAPRFRNSRILRIVFMAAGSAFFHAAIFLAVYKLRRGMDFDFYFIWYNLAEAFPTVWRIYAAWCMLVGFSFIGFIIFQALAYAPLRTDYGKGPGRILLLMSTVFSCSILFQALNLETIRGSAAGFIYSNFLSRHPLRHEYERLYREHIRGLSLQLPKKNGRKSDSLLGDVVFLLKQESLDGLLASPRVTPQLFQASKEGILFTHLYGNSIQSQRGYECILCGVPPSIRHALADEYSSQELYNLYCLPRVFRSLGYRTLYFFGGSRNPRITRFAQSIGFEQVLSDEITQPKDPRYRWGYREDIYYSRIHQYLQRHHAKDKIFVYIDVGATNHAPFKLQDHSLKDGLPFPHPLRPREALANTTYVQDAYFGSFYTIFKKYYANRGTLISISDHSWPVQAHKNNFFNERGGFEENFVIPMLFIPPAPKRNVFAVGTRCIHSYSQMDLYPTLLELIGTNRQHLLGESFASWLLAAPVRERAKPLNTKISIQPYGDAFISAVRFPEKYLFNVRANTVTVYDLAKDPAEHSGQIHNAGEYKFLINDFFKLPLQSLGQ